MKKILEKLTIKHAEYFNLFLWILTLVACIGWYDFKLFVIIFLFAWSNNLQIYINALKEKQKY